MTDENGWSNGPASGLPRLEELSEPKKRTSIRATEFGHHYVYSYGRESAIWQVPNNSALAATCSQRVKELAQPKMSSRPHNQKERTRVSGSGGYSRPDVVRGRTNDTQPADDNSSRLAELARSRSYHGDFQQSRPVQTIISRALLVAPLREKSEALATPKQRLAGPFRDPEWKVSAAAKSATARPRCQTLAAPKSLHADYQHNRTTARWPVSRGALRTRPSGRTMELSVPVTRATMGQVLYDPDAFTVRPAALKAFCTPRIRILATPVNR